MEEGALTAPMSMAVRTSFCKGSVMIVATGENLTAVAADDWRETKKRSEAARNNAIWHDGMSSIDALL